MLERKESQQYTKARNIDFAVLVAGGPLRTIPSNLKMSHSVEILTTPSCANCKVVERILDDLNVAYDVIDVTERPEYLEKYPIFTAPGIVIDNKLEFIGMPKKQELAEKLL